MTRASKWSAALLLTTVVGASAYAATQRDNDVYFAIAGVQNFSFADTEHSIHSGQPWGGISANVTRPGAEGHILVKAGRKGSSAVAQWFKTRVGGGQTLVCDSKGTFPDELNFAAKGTLRFSISGKNYTCNDILIGQGHFATVNNWWMGGPQMKGAHASFSGGTAQLCKADGEPLPVPVVFTPQTPCSNHFNIARVDAELSSLLGR